MRVSSSTEPAPCSPHPFAHPAEAEFAAFLDFYRIRWLYEPNRSRFAKKGAPSRCLRPTSTSGQDLYVELTTMKQSLVTRKNRKVRGSASSTRTSTSP